MLERVKKNALKEEVDTLIQKFLPFTDTDSSNILSAIQQGTYENAANCAIKCCEILIENEPGFTMLNPRTQLEWKEHWEEVIKILKSKAEK